MAIADSLLLGTIAVLISAKVALLAAIAVVVVWNLSKQDRERKCEWATTPDRRRKLP